VIPFIKFPNPEFDTVVQLLPSAEYADLLPETATNLPLPQATSSKLNGMFDTAVQFVGPPLCAGVPDTGPTDIHEDAVPSPAAFTAVTLK
jgi:hypothetical protein